MPDPDLEIRGGGGERSYRPLDKGGTVSQKFFSAPGASVWSNNKGREGPPGPSPGSATAIYMGQPEFRIKNQIVRAILIGKLQKDYANYKKNNEKN